MATQAIDYSALAKQAGAIDSQPAGSGIDYGALAKQAGAIDSQPAPQSQPQQPRTWMDSATDFGKQFLAQVNPITAVKGIAQTVMHPVDAYNADANARNQLRGLAEQAFDKASKSTNPAEKANWYANGATYMLQGILPVIGPALQGPASKIEQGNVAAGLGQATGMAANLAAPEIAQNIKLPSLPAGASKVAERLYQSALKPSPASYSTGEVGNMIKTGLENSIPVSADGADKIASLVSDLNSKISSQIQAGSNAGATVNKFAVASRLSGVAQKFATQVNPEADLADVSNSGNEFLRNQPNDIPASDAQALKQGTYQQLGNKNFGELRSATMESQKGLARGIKEELQTQFPEIQGLNAQEGKLLDLREPLERAVRRIDNRDIVSLGTAVAGGAGTAAAGGASGVAAMILKRVIEDPVVKSRLAIALNKASKGRIPMSAAQARVAGYVNALGNAANSEQSGDPSNE